MKRMLLCGLLLSAFGWGAQGAAAAGLGFSHAVVVDEQRPGNSPEVKVDGSGVIYTSSPFAFSPTQSFVWASHDAGNSYQFVPGTLGAGKPSFCGGGAASDLFVDSRNQLYYADLLGQTNIANSTSSDGGSSWTTNCSGAPNTPAGRMWLAGRGAASSGNLDLYEAFDVVDGALPSGGNQLVEAVSHDGTTFSAVVNSSPMTTGCSGAGVDCVTGNEATAGNQVVDPVTGDVYIVHTTTDGDSSSTGAGVMVAEGKITAGSPTTAQWSESPNLAGPLCPDPSCVDASGNPEELVGENVASVARDSSGYLYVAFTAAPLDHASGADPNFGGLTAPEEVYVVHSLEPAGTNPASLTWSAPAAVAGTGTNTLPWITAGSNGRVDVAWYHTNEASRPGTCASGTGTCTLYGAGSLTDAQWNVQMAQSLNANAANPVYATTDVSESYVKHGQVCTLGTGCASGGDHSLGNSLQVTIDGQGAALVSYVFDTSVDSSGGQNAGPEVISRQISGPSLLAAVGSVSQGNGPGRAMGSVTDPSGDAYYSANGSHLAAGRNLDLTGASLAEGPGNTLVAKIHVSQLSSLAVSQNLGGPDASWLIRWTMVTPGVTGNGHIFYAGMDNNAGAGGTGHPSFFSGDTGSSPAPGSGQSASYLTYPQTHVLGASAGSYDPSTGVITLHVPLSDVGSPRTGTPLYSVTALTATSSSPQSATTLFNQIDATPPFDVITARPPVPPTPALTGLHLSPTSFALAGRLFRGRCVAATSRNHADRACTRAIRLTVSYRLNIAAQVRLTLQRSRAGRAVQGRCVAPSRQNENQPSCTRLTGLSGALNESGRSGTNQFVFDGRVGGHSLGPGSYRLTASPTAGGKAGTARTVAFRIAP